MSKPSPSTHVLSGIPAPLLIVAVALAITAIVVFVIPLLIERIAPSTPFDKVLYDRFLRCTGPNACLDR